tara:strand:- start:44 stop:376 length:333 start_codon:yes stop_codon:yes gene_type:complete
MKITKSQLKQIIKEEMEAVKEIDWTRVKTPEFETGGEHEDAARYVETCRAEVDEEIEKELSANYRFHLNPDPWVKKFNKCMDDKIRQLKIKQDPATWLGEADNTPELKDA